MTNFLTLMAQKPADYKLATTLSLVSLDETISAEQRACAMVLLHDLCMPYILRSQGLLTGPKREVKPKYRWIQGARVKL